MFDTILDAIKSFWDAGKLIVANIWDACRSSAVWILASFTAFIAITQRVMDFVWEQITFMCGLFQGLLIGNRNSEIAAAGSAVGDALVVANTFFPVQEALTLMGMLALLTITATLYRFIKSCIPTLS